MTGRSFALSIATTIGVLTVAAYCSMGPKAPTEKQQAEKVRYEVLKVVDSARVRELEAEVARLGERGLKLTFRAQASDSVAAMERARAESLKALAIVEPAAWEETANAAMRSADAAISASHQKDSIIAVRDTQMVAKDSIVWSEVARRSRAEARVAQLEPLALKADDCKIVKFINCPTRKQAFVAGGVVTLSALALAFAR